MIGEQAMAFTKNNTRKINLFDLTAYLPGQLLTKVDRTSMMHSLEVRCPFLDHKLAEYVYNIPEEYKMDRASGKIILKDILSEIMPREFVYRRKQGFGAPIGTWLKQDAFRALVAATLENNNAAVYNFLDPKVTKQLLVEFYQQDQKTHALRIWTLLCLELWYTTHKIAV